MRYVCRSDIYSNISRCVLRWSSPHIGIEICCAGEQLLALTTMTARSQRVELLVALLLDTAAKI